MKQRGNEPALRSSLLLLSSLWKSQHLSVFRPTFIACAVKGGFAIEALDGKGTVSAPAVAEKAVRLLKGAVPNRLLVRNSLFLHLYPKWMPHNCLCFWCGPVVKCGLSVLD